MVILEVESSWQRYEQTSAFLHNTCELHQEAVSSALIFTVNIA